jgi:hypothetical protein
LAGGDADPEHYEIWDEKKHEYIPWSAVVTPVDLRGSSRSELIEAYGERAAETLLKQVDR